jgi:glutamate-1-semialdehyde 2,1-aminomutase
MTTIDRTRLADLIEREARQFEAAHPVSRRLADAAVENMVLGVPMLWMRSPHFAFSLFAERGSGARIYDVDGHEYLDFFLSISAATFGHSPDAMVRAVSEQVRDGVTFMLPTEDSVWLGKELNRRFGLPKWQPAMTATDAVRFVLRIARAVSGRRKVLVFNGCFHGVLAETMVGLRDGVVTPTLALSEPTDVSLTTKVIEFNDVKALEVALAPGDVACVVTEPALTNCSMVLPEPGFHDALRAITRDTGTYLAIDETHTICTGPGGYTRAYGLDPDFLVIGKSIAGGIPMAAYGCRAEIAKGLEALLAEDHDIGIVGTLIGNALAVKAARATMEHVMTDANYARMIALRERLVAGAERVIEAHGLPWQFAVLGCRAEIHFRREPPRTGAEGLAIIDHELEKYIQLFFLNRGILVTNFQNTRLTSPTLTEDDVDRHTTVFEECVATLTGTS